MHCENDLHITVEKYSLDWIRFTVNNEPSMPNVIITILLIPEVHRDFQEHNRLYATQRLSPQLEIGK